MALTNVVQAQKAIQRSNDSSGFGTETWMHEIRGLLDGEMLTLRIGNLPNQPHIFRKHSGSQGPGGFDVGICLSPQQPCPACIGCEPEYVNKRKRVKRASDVASFIVYSCRQLAQVPSQKQDGSTYNRGVTIHRNAGGQVIYNANYGIRGAQPQIVTAPDGQFWLPFKNPQPGQPNGRLVNLDQFEMKEEGWTLWTGSLHSKGNNAINLITLEAQLSGRCRCGGTTGSGANLAPAAIRTTQHTCGNCGSPVAFDPQNQIEVVCGTCHQSGKPDEEISCSADCGNPRRGSVTECYIQVQRQGGGTDTAYSFSALPFSEPEPHHVPTAQTELPNPAVLYAPDRQKLVAGMLARGVQPPADPNQMPQNMGYAPQGYQQQPNTQMQPGQQPAPGQPGMVAWD